MSDPAVLTTGLGKSYGAHVALADLDLAIPRGAIMGLLGPNGAGKTTTLRILAGLLRASSGAASVLGVDVARDAWGVKERVAYQPQGDAVYGDLTARENVEFVLRLHGVSREGRHGACDAALEATRITSLASRRAAHLSGGERRRLALACAIVLRQELLILDEPTAGLDPVSREEVWQLLHRLRHEGATILVTTHHMDEADRCTHLGVLIGGRLRRQGTPERLRAEYPYGLVELQPLPGVAAGEIARRLGAVHVAYRGTHLRAAIPAARAGDAPAAAAALGTDVRTAAPTLEDVYLHLAGRPPGAPA
jgi:ABC-2 type transport system ATP-binding protein